MRAAVGELELDEILHARQKLNTIIKTALLDAAYSWGIEIRRYEITEISPDKQISLAMDKQAAAERNRREKVLNAEGEKSKETLESEGIKIRLTNESEGRMIQIRNEAQAMKQQAIFEAEGEAISVQLRAEAQAKSIQVIADALKTDQGKLAAQLQIAAKYIEMYGDIGQKSNTMIFSDKPGDLNSLLAQAALVINSVNKQDK